MQLNHLDLSVPDVAAAAAFFLDGFGFCLLEQRGRGGMAILQGSGMVLVLTRDPQPVYPASFHIGFLQPTPEAVHAAHQHLLAIGIEVPAAPALMRGTLLFYCRVPGGILVEVSYRAKSG